MLSLFGCGGAKSVGSTPVEPTVVAQDAPVPPAPVQQVSTHEDRVVTTSQGSRAAVSQAWSQQATQFALEMHRGVVSAKRHATSGVSAAIAMSMLAEGATGSTREAFATALGAPISTDLHIDNERAIAAFNGTPSVELAVANGLWVREGLELQAPFVSVLSTHYGTTPTTLPLGSDAPAAADVINRWADQHSFHMIPTLFDADQLRGSELVLANAVAFKGKWVQRFDPKSTAPATFHGVGGDTQVPMMHLSASIRYLKAEGYQVVMLPYEGLMSSMVLLLPDDGRSLSDLEGRLDAKALTTAASRAHERKVVLGLPRFTIEEEHDLPTVLAGLGLKEVLSGAGDFSGIAGGLQVGHAIQKVFLQVDEEGTQAAAVTGVTMRRSLPAPPVEVTFNRPFLFMIWHKETRTPLFMGSVEEL